MTDNWQETELGKLLTLQRGFDLPIQDRREGSVPIVSSSGITGNHSKAMVPAPGVVTGRYGTIGEVFYLERDFWPLNTTLFVKDFKGNDPRFVFYLLKTIDFDSCSDKSSVPGVNRNDLHRLRVRIPPFAEQRAIAHILGALDDKIELNRRMNETLEAMARATFKSWFIDFDPVRRNIARRTGRNQPSPPAPLPKGEGVHYRGGFEFAGLLETARELRRKQTPVEEILWEILRNRCFLGLKFRRQHQIGDYVVDFYCREHRLVVELDGPAHATQRNKQKDAKRDAYLGSLGLTIVRFLNRQVLDNPEHVLEKIAAAVRPLPLGGDSEGGVAELDRSVTPLPMGEGGGEGGVEGVDALFPDSFQDSPLGKIPKDWAVEAFNEMIEIIGGGTPKTSVPEYWAGDIPWFSVVDAPACSDVFVIDTEKRITQAGLDNSSAKLLPVGTTIISARGTVGELALAGVPMAMNQSCYGIRGKGSRGDYFTHFALRDLLGELRQTTHGTVFDTITRDTFKVIKAVIPPIGLTQTFDSAVLPYLDRVLANLRESRTLSALRDTLLPKLISGAIRVRDAEKIVGAKV